jgi:hypothetical protein
MKIFHSSTVLLLALATPTFGALLPACGQGKGNDQAAAESDPILGGVAASSPSLDAVGTVGTVFNGTYFEYCTASLVGPRTVLTERACLHDWPNNALFVDEQPVFFALGPDSSAPRRLVQVSSVVEPASPIAGGFQGLGVNVAIYQLSEPITDVAPLPYVGASVSTGDRFVVVGFGQSAGGYLQLRQAGSIRINETSGQPLHDAFSTVDAFLAAMQAADPSFNAYAALYRALYDASLVAGQEAWAGRGPSDAQVCYGDLGAPLIRAVNGQRTVFGVALDMLPGATAACSLGSPVALLTPEVLGVIATGLADPCAGLTELGRCSGATAIRCTTATEGPRRPVVIDCGGLLQTCALDATTRAAACVDPPAMPSTPSH